MAKEKLTTQQKAERVLASQGLGIARLASFPDDVQKQLAEHCDDNGIIKAGSMDVINKFWDAQKASVDRDAK